MLNPTDSNCNNYDQGATKSSAVHEKKINNPSRMKYAPREKATYCKLRNWNNNATIHSFVSVKKLQIITAYFRSFASLV